ncbi:MAG: DNA gyrase subunit A [Chloroflexi bacterium]|nr:DNA gyrase subunit A [Chloroflexota bacterium]
MEIGQVKPIDIDQEMRSAYIDYAMSVIVSRALPDARDGLKPVHRRILFAMHDMGMRSNAPYKKSARIVGEVLGKYHPHGDSAVYEAMARMAQDFSMRYPLVDGQGNFGSVDGDAPAAMRYTEARLGPMAEEMLVDIDKDTVNFSDNFDGTLQEPDVLPSRLPNLLLNGSSGIAVGMATNVPPHNLRELVNALNYMIDRYDEMADISVNDLMRFVSGPDFPTGGVLVGMESIRQAYTTGSGRLTLRGSATIEEMKGGRYSIVITEIPYQVSKSSLIERIAELARSERISGISDLRDESDRSGMSIIVELRRGAQPQKVLNQLFKYTALQSTFGMRTLALVGGEPRILSLKRALQIYLEHREVVITRRSAYELEKARQRAHILDGLLIALANLDDVIQTIRQSPDVDIAKERLVSRFNLTEIQAQAILDLQLRRLAALERQKIEDEHRQVCERIAYLEELLQNPKKILEVIREDLNELAEKYGDERRTRIAPEADSQFSEEDLIADQPMLVTITLRGYVKRMPVTAFRTLGRGRKGVTGQDMRDEDEVKIMLHTRTLHTLLFFSNKGKVYSLRAYQIPEAGRTDRGVPVVNLLSVEQNEMITAVVSVPDFKLASYCTMATFKGFVKRIEISDFAGVRPSGLIAINLENDDTLGWVRMTSGKDDIILVTEQGQALRYSEQVLRPTGRQSRGVRGIRLGANDRMTSMEVVEPNGQLLVLTEKGYGKRTPLEEYAVKGRATGGIRTINPGHFPIIGKVAAARVVQESDDITIITSGGIALRLRVDGIRSSGRATRGVHIIDLKGGDKIASVARVTAEELSAPQAKSPNNSFSPSEAADGEVEPEPVPEE